jgi:hypothetical protein
MPIDVRPYDRIRIADTAMFAATPKAAGQVGWA